MYSVFFDGKEAVVIGYLGYELCHFPTFKEAMNYSKLWVAPDKLPDDWDGIPLILGNNPIIEIRNSNIALTDQEVTDLYSINGIYAFPFEKLCSRCGDKWLSHDDMKCPTYPYATFLPVVQDPSANDCDGFCSTCDGCKGSSCGQKKLEPTKEEMPEWKRWRNDQPGNCPCGIVKEDCWIHR